MIYDEFAKIFIKTISDSGDRSSLHICLTLARTNPADAVHRKGQGVLLWVAIYSLMACSRSATLRNTPRPILFNVMIGTTNQ